jgi:hypothetical protein
MVIQKMDTLSFLSEDFFVQVHFLWGDDGRWKMLKSQNGSLMLKLLTERYIYTCDSQGM